MAHWDRPEYRDQIHRTAERVWLCHQQGNTAQAQRYLRELQRLVREAEIRKQMLEQAGVLETT